jgi:hypothetical protein
MLCYNSVFCYCWPFKFTSIFFYKHWLGVRNPTVLTGKIKWGYTIFWNVSLLTRIYGNSKIAVVMSLLPNKKKIIMQESAARTVSGWQNLVRTPRLFCGTSTESVSHKPHERNLKYAEQGSRYSDSWSRYNNRKQLGELGVRIPALHSKPLVLFHVSWKRCTYSTCWTNVGTCHMQEQRESQHRKT